MKLKWRIKKWWNDQHMELGSSDGGTVIWTDYGFKRKLKDATKNSWKAVKKSVKWIIITAIGAAIVTAAGLVVTHYAKALLGD